MTPYQMYPISEALKCEEKNHYLGTAKICVTECLLCPGNKRAPFWKYSAERSLNQNTQGVSGTGPK